MLDVTRLRALDAVATTGSVTAAARLLHYAQPSVSHHLARLEAETGARLTRPAGRGIVLTDEGELLARRAREILGRLDAAEAELAAVLGQRAGRLRIAAFQSAMSVLLPPVIAQLRQQVPDLELRLADYAPAAALRQLRDGEIDAAIVFHYEDTVAHDDIRYLHLIDDPIYLLAQAPDQSLTDHRGSAWIAGCDYCRAELIRTCQTAGFTPHIAYTSEDVIIDQALVAAGLGVTTMSGLALRAYRAGGLHATPIPRARRRVSIALLGEPPDPPLTTAFVTALRGLAHDLYLGTTPGS